MVQAESQAVVADVAFCELVSGSEFKGGAETYLIVIQDSGASNQDRNQKRQGALEFFCRRSALFQQNPQEKGSGESHGQQSHVGS